MTTTKTETAAKMAIAVEEPQVEISALFPKDPALVKALKGAKITTVSELEKTPVGDLIRMPGLGSTRLALIVRRLVDVK